MINYVFCLRCDKKECKCKCKCVKWQSTVRNYCVQPRQNISNRYVNLCLSSASIKAAMIKCKTSFALIHKAPPIIYTKVNKEAAWTLSKTFCLHLSPQLKAIHKWQLLTPHLYTQFPASPMIFIKARHSNSVLSWPIRRQPISHIFSSSQVREIWFL